MAFQVTIYLQFTLLQVKMLVYWMEPKSHSESYRELFQEGFSYSSLNSYRSAISSVHERTEGIPVGKHLVIVRILKGAFNIKPPQPRYKSTLSVSQVIVWLDTFKNIVSTPILDLSIRTVMLCVLAKRCRSAKLATWIMIPSDSPLRVPLLLHWSPLNSVRLGIPSMISFFPTFTENQNICPVAALQSYCLQTVCRHGTETKQIPGSDFN